MAESKKGKSTVIYCTCPACEARLIVDEDGNIIQSFYEEDEGKAKAEASKHISEPDKEENGDKSPGEASIPEDKKAEAEKDDPPEDNSDEKEDTEDSKNEFELGGW